MLTCNWYSWLPNEYYSQLLRNRTILFHTITLACASCWNGASAGNITTIPTNISHTEASSTLPQERRLSSPGASGNTGGGWDRDNAEGQNRAGHPQPTENGYDVEAAAWLTLDSILFKREESSVSDRHAAQYLLPCSAFYPLCPCLCHFLPLSSPSAAATYSSGFIQDAAPFDDDCISIPPTGAVAKAAESFLGNHLF